MTERRNKRFSKMMRLEKEGYFSIEAIRKRMPYHYQTFLGKDPLKRPIISSHIISNIYDVLDEEIVSELYRKQVKEAAVVGEAILSNLDMNESERAFAEQELVAFSKETFLAEESDVEWEGDEWEERDKEEIYFEEIEIIDKSVAYERFSQTENKQDYDY